MQLSTVGPESNGARAQLLFAFLILALLPVVLISIPAQTQGLRFDFGPIATEPGMSAGEAGWVRPYVRRFFRTPYEERELFLPAPVPSSGPRHRLDLLPSGELLLDSRPIDLAGLRSRLDAMLAAPGWIDFHPHPDARYEAVIEALAPFAHSGFDRLRLDNSRYLEAFEAAAAE